MRTFWYGLGVQRRVWVALFLREIQTRWGRRNLGFAWLFAEPLVFAFPVLTMWSYMRSPFERGVPLIPFLWSGYLPLLIFRHCGGRALGVVRQNAALLYHRGITPLDLFAARCGLEAIGTLAACFFSFMVLYALGFVDWPYDLRLVLVGLFYMAAWSVAIALNVAALSERSEIVEHVWQPISYLYMPVCGCFFLAEWLPTSLRNIVLIIDPPVHCYEMIRSGLFGNKIHAYYDQSYITYIILVLAVSGLWLMRNVRQFVDIS